MPATHVPSRKVWLGREREVSELQGGLDDLVSGEGRGNLFLITGEPGIGKTRLADELGRVATARGLAVHWGRAWEAGGAPSYWPFIQVLRSMCRGLDAASLGELVGDRAAELVELMPELRQRIPEQLKASSTASFSANTTERFQLFEAVNMFVQSAIARAPQVVVLDDLHAADPSSLLLLHFLVRGLRSGWNPLLVIGTYREAEARLTSEIGRTLALVSREATSVLPLRRLDRGEVAAFVAQTTGSAPDADRTEQLHQRTEGNPLFLRELLQLQQTSVGKLDGTREIIRARLSLLAPAVRSTLETAAILGRELELDLLAAMVKQTEGVELDVPTRITPAADAAIIEPLEPLSARWRFTHVLLRESLYEDLPADRRAELHRAAAIELQRRCAGSSEPPLAELAHHFLQAFPTAAASVGEVSHAVLRAAERATNLLAFEDASALLARANELFEEQHFEVLLALGVARSRGGDLKLGRDTAFRAASLARRLGDGELFARAVLGAACEYVWGVRDLTLIALLEEALAVLPPGDGPLRARCMAQLAAERQPEPDTSKPIELAREAIAMARRVGDVETLRITLTNASLAMFYALPSERVLLDQECLRLARVAGDTIAVQRAHLLLMAAAGELGDKVGAEAHGRAYLEVMQRRHSRFGWMRLAVDLWRASWEGRFDDVTKMLEASTEMRSGDEGAGIELGAAPVGLCRVWERYNDLAAIEARVRAAFGSMDSRSAQALGADVAGVRADTPPPPLGSCIGELVIAHLYGRIDRQRSEAQLAVVRAHPLFSEIKEPAWLACLVDACHLLRDVALAEQLYAALLPHADRFFSLGPFGSYSEAPYGRLLGLLAETLGRVDEAITRLADAEAKVVEAAMFSQLARIRYELAGALLARSRPDDRQRAASLLDEAHALAEQLGQTGLLPLLAARRAEAGVAPTPTAPAAVAAAPATSDASADPLFTLRREGDYWTLSFSHARDDAKTQPQTLRLRDSRGLQVLERLVTRPDQELHVLQLISVSAGDTASETADAATTESTRDGGDSGTVLDEAAVQSYRSRLLELREELEEAERFADAGRIDRARTEIDFLTQELARAVGLGGRARRVGGAAERARTTIQKRLREAIRRIADELPDLGKHLDQSIRTGTFCGYFPEGRPLAKK